MNKGALGFLLLVVLAASAMRPTKVYEKAMENALDAEKFLLKCRAENHDENLKDIACFREALKTFAYNASWSKQISALYVMTAQRQEAYRHFNTSLYTILDAQGFTDKKVMAGTAHFSPTSWLKLYHAREKEGGLELAKVWFQKMLYEHRNEEAQKIIKEFIEPLEDYKDSTDLFRSLGSIGDVINTKMEWRKWKDESRRKKGKKVTKREAELTINIVAEEIQRMSEELANRWLSARLTMVPEGRNESLGFFKKMCGVDHAWKGSYHVSDMTHFLNLCVVKWGNLKDTLLLDGLPGTYGALMRTPLHSLAVIGSDYVIRAVAEKFPELILTLDNFGSTPLHYATAHGNRRAISTLLRAGGLSLLKHKDAGNFSPLQIGCRNAKFRDDFEAMLAKDFSLPNACATVDPLDRIQDDETEDEELDGMANGGGWANAAHNPETSSCSFDIRSGASLSHHELVGSYLHASRPVVLRNVIPAKIRKLLQRKELLAKHPSLSLREESFPGAQLYGGALKGIVELQDWVYNHNDSFATVEVPKRHKLSHVLEWLPSRLLPEHEGYTALDDSWPMLVLAGQQASTNHVYRSAHTAFSLSHGVQHWSLTPPFLARTSRGRLQTNITDDSVFKCTIHGGDVMVIPALWSAAFWSVGESVGVQRRFIWK
jgi:tetratricopeptide (TPR) repeat protein